MSKLNYILDNHRRHSQARQQGLSRPPGMDTEQAAGAIKVLMLNIIGEDARHSILCDGNKSNFAFSCTCSANTINAVLAKQRAKVEQL
jgi:hypothetical protein